MSKKNRSNNTASGPFPFFQTKSTTEDPVTGVLSESTTSEEAPNQQEETTQVLSSTPVIAPVFVSTPAPVSVPTKTTITCVLGAIDAKNANVLNTGSHNSTRWVFDVVHEGSTAVELSFQLLKFSSKMPFNPGIMSFTLGAQNGNFYVARPHIIEERGLFTLRTFELKQSAVVKYRVSIDTLHSTNR